MNQMEELICPQCLQIFDEQDNLPLMLPDCGHTICQQCITKILSSGGQVICPEDHIEAKNKTDIQSFPKNCQLLKMVIKQKCQGQQRQSTKSEDEVSYQVQLNNLMQTDTPNDLCSEHLEKLEIVCLTDQARICTRCALFGTHRQHIVRSVDDVVKEITQKAENIMQIYQKILDKQSELTELKYFEPVQDKFNNLLSESQFIVKEKFKDLHQQLEQKEQLLIKQITGITQVLEQQYKKQIKELLQSCQQQAELWKITAKDKLVYFSTKTENGDLPLDLLNNQEFGCVEKGKTIYDDLEKTQKQLELKLQNIKLRKIRVDMKKNEIDKCFENLYTITLQENNNNQQIKQTQITKQINTLIDSTILSEIKKNDNINKLYGYDIFSSFCQDEPMLLKDSSIADWGESLMDDTLQNINSTTTTISQTKADISQQKQCEIEDNNIKQKLQTEQNCLSIPVSPLIHSTTPERLQIRTDKLKGSQEHVSSLRQGISPITKMNDQKKKTIKMFKINEKFEVIWQAFKSDNIEQADFSSADLGDEGLYHISEIMKISKRVKQLKLVRNKITDESACRLLDCLYSNQNQIFQSLHLSSNMITERTLDYFISLVKNQSIGNSLPKFLYLNQTLINATKAKKKLEDMKKIGYLINI